MIKLTDPEYRLPFVEALSAFDLFDMGTTAPLGLWGVDTETAERGQYVVKLKKSSKETVVGLSFSSMYN